MNYRNSFVVYGYVMRFYYQLPFEPIVYSTHQGAPKSSNLNRWKEWTPLKMAIIKDALNALKNVHTEFGSAISTHSPLVVRLSRGTGASILLYA